MSEWDRRSIIASAASLMLRRSAAVSLGGLLVLPSSPANAFIMEALAVAGTVANLIGSKTQGGGMGALLSADHELLKTALDGISDLQDQVGKILAKLDDLKDEIDAGLRRQETRQLHTEIKKVIAGYRDLLETKNPDLTDNEWRGLETTKSDISTLYSKYNDARLGLNVLDLTDPATALVATPACFVGISLAVIRGSSDYEIAAQIRTWHLRWLDAILDPGRVGSTANYAQAAAERLKIIEKEAAESAFGRAYGVSTREQLFACTGVDDYRAPYSTRPPIGCQEFAEVELPEGTDATDGKALAKLSQMYFSDKAPPGSENADIAVQALATVGSPFAEDPPSSGKAGTIKVARFCGQSSISHPERVGIRDRLARDVILSDIELVVDGVSTGLMQLDVQVGPDRHGVSGAADLPADVECSVERRDLQDPTARLAYMTQMTSRKNAEAGLTAFREIVGRLNLERAKVAFGIQTMTATESARRKLLDILKRAE